MENLTQEQLNEMINEFKDGVSEQAKESGRSLEMLIALGDQCILQAFAMYQEDVIPAVEDHGLSAPSLSELFGIDIKLSVKDDEE